MGFVPMIGAVFVVFVVNFVGAVFSGWVLKFVYKSALKVLAPKQRRTRGSRPPPPTSHSDVLCPCVFKRFSTVQFTLGITVATIAMFILADLIKVAAMAVHLFTCFHCGKGVTQTQKWFNGAQLLCLCAGYGLMLVTHFERLRLTFRNTFHKIPKWAPKVLYADILLGVSLVIVEYTFLYTQPIVAVVCIALTLLLYLTSCTALGGAFFKKTMAVVGSAEKRDTILVHTAARVTVSVTVSLLSTFVCFVFFSLAVVCCPMCLFWMCARDVLMTLDMAINAFCLMCTLRDATPLYHSAFGRLHKLLLAHMSAEPSTEMIVQTTIDANETAVETAKSNDSD